MRGPCGILGPPLSKDIINVSESIRISQAGAGRNQALRTAVTLSVLTGRPITYEGAVDEGFKPKPGLGPGTVTAVKAAAAISGAGYEARMGQTEGFLKPREPRSGDYVFDVATQRKSAAAISPIMLCLLPILAASQGASSLIVTGGTHIHGAPTSDEMRYVLMPTLRSLGLPVTYSEIAPGFLPVGGGEGELQVRGPASFMGIHAENPFRPENLHLEVVSSGLPVHLAEMALQGAQDRLAVKGIKAEGNIRRARGGHGLSVLAWSDGNGYRVGFSALGHRGGRPEAVAIQAVEGLMDFFQSGAGMPTRQAADLLLPLACAKGVSRIRLGSINQPIKATARVIEQFWPGTVQVTDRHYDKPAEIRINGRDFGRGA